MRTLFSTEAHLALLLICPLFLAACQSENGRKQNPAAWRASDDKRRLGTKIDPIWRLVAHSEVIVVGKPNVSTWQLCTKPGKYVEIPVKSVEVIKGSAPDPVEVTYFNEAVFYSPSPQQLAKSNRKKYLLFLTRAGDEFSSQAELYFAGSSLVALTPFEEGLVKLVATEVEEQKQLLANFDKLFPTNEVPYYQEVKNLLNAVTRKADARRALDKLEALGTNAVPALILLMDDRRSFSLGTLALENKSKNAFEAFRQYGPKQIVDAVAAILNQITGESFGAIYSGGTETARAHEVEGWRIYLCHSKGKTVKSGP